MGVSISVLVTTMETQNRCNLLQLCEKNGTHAYLNDVATTHTSNSADVSDVYCRAPSPMCKAPKVSPKLQVLSHPIHTVRIILPHPPCAPTLCNQPQDLYQLNSLTQPNVSHFWRLLISGVPRILVAGASNHNNRPLTKTVNFKK